MESAPSDFAFIGARDYVHGPSIFEAFRSRALEAAGAPAAGDFSFRFLRINQTLHANGTIVITRADEPQPRWGRPAAEMSCRAGTRQWYVALYDRESRPITRREIARERDFVCNVRISGALNGEATLAGVRNNADLFQAVVEANKQVHVKTLTGDPVSAAVKFRFVYCLDYACAPSLENGTGKVVVRSEGLREAGAHRFSLTALDLTLGGFSSTFKLCFASKDMHGLKDEAPIPV